MNKKIIITAAVITVIILVGGYFFITRSSSQPTQTIPNGSPFGGGGPNANRTSVPPSQPTLIAGVENQIQTTAGLRKITSTPVSDAIFVPGSGASSTKIQFIERATGNIYEADLTTNAITRKTNTTIPKIENVVWGKPGSSFVGQTMGVNGVTSQIFLIGTSSIASIPGAFTSITNSSLPDNILAISFSPLADKIFYVVRGFQGAEGYVTNNHGVSPTLVWQFPTDEWLTQWNTGDTVALTSKASNGVPGFMYFLNTKTKTTTLKLSSISGLTTNLSPSGLHVFYDSITNGVWQSNVYNVKTGITSPLSLQTLPEKCVWAINELAMYCGVPRSISANAPDDWYQGLASYDDDIWKLDLSDGTTIKIATLNPSPNTTIDTENPRISPDGAWMLFMNKKDLSLWATPLP